MLNRSMSGRIFEIGSDGDDVTVGDISIYHCYRKELRARLDHLQKLNLIVGDDISIKGEDFFQLPLRPASSSPTGNTSLCVAQVCRAYVTLAYKHYLITHEYALGDAQLQYVQKLIQQRLGQYIEQSNGERDLLIPPLSACDQLYVQRLYELLSFELLRCHSLSLVQQAKFSLAVKRLSLAIDTVPSIDSHFSAGLADALLLSYECYKALASATPPVNINQHNNSDNKLQDKALQAAKLAVNVAHERMRLAVARDSNEEYFLKYADVFLGESVVLDCCTSLVLAYVALGEALELDHHSKNSNDHEGTNDEMAMTSTNDWFVRALQTAEKHHLDEGLISELQRLVNTKRNASNSAKLAMNKAGRGNTASVVAQPQQRSVLLLDEDDDEEENDFDRVFFAHTNGYNTHVKKGNSPERKSRPTPTPVSNVPTNHLQNMINRPRSALPRLSDMNNSNNNNSENNFPSGVPQMVNVNNSLPHNHNNNHVNTNHITTNIPLTVNTLDNESLHRPRSALSKLGESYNNYTPHSNLRNTPNNSSNHQNNLYDNSYGHNSDPNQYFQTQNTDILAMNPYSMQQMAPPVSPNGYSNGYSTNISYSSQENYKYPYPNDNYPYFPQHNNSNNNNNGASYQTLPSYESFQNTPYYNNNNSINNNAYNDFVKDTGRRSESSRKPPLLLHSNSSRAIILLPSNLSVTSDKDRKVKRPESGKRKPKSEDNQNNNTVDSSVNNHGNNSNNVKKGSIRPASAAAVLCTKHRTNSNNSNNITSNNNNNDNDSRNKNNSQNKVISSKKLLHSQSTALLPPMTTGKTQKNKTLLSRTLSSFPPNHIISDHAHSNISNSDMPVYNISVEQLQQQAQQLEEVYLPFFKGMSVEARYQKHLLGEKKPLWLPGRIVDADFRSARYTVEFAHGGLERNISAEDIRINAAHSKQHLQQQAHVKCIEYKTDVDHTHVSCSSVHFGHKHISAQEVRSKTANDMYVNMLRILRETAERRPFREEEKCARQLLAIVPMQALIRGVLARVKFHNVNKEQLIQRKQVRDEKAKEAQAKDLLLATLLHEKEELLKEKLAREEQDRLMQLMEEKENEEKQKLLEEEQWKERELEREKAQFEANQQQHIIYTLQKQNEILSQQLEELRKDLKRSLAMLHHQNLLVQQQAQHANNNNTNNVNNEKVSAVAKEIQAVEQEEKLQRMMLSIEDRLLSAMQQHQRHLQLQQTQLQHTLLTQSQSQDQNKPATEKSPELAKTLPEQNTPVIFEENEEVLKGVQTEMAQLKDALHQTLAFVQQFLSLNQLQLQQQHQQQLQLEHQLHLQQGGAHPAVEQEPEEDDLLYAYFDQFNSSLLRPSHSEQGNNNNANNTNNVLHRNNTNIAAVGEPDDNDNLDNEDDDDDVLVVGLGERGLLSAPVSSGGSLFQYNNDMLMQDEADEMDNGEHETAVKDDTLVQGNILINRSVHSVHPPQMIYNEKHSINIDTNIISINNSNSQHLEEESSPQVVFLSLSQFELPPFMSTSLSNEDDSSPAVQHNCNVYFNKNGCNANNDNISNINNVHSWLIASDSLSVVPPATQQDTDEAKSVINEVTNTVLNNVEVTRNSSSQVNDDYEFAKEAMEGVEIETEKEVQNLNEHQKETVVAEDNKGNFNVAIVKESESPILAEVIVASENETSQQYKVMLRESIHETAYGVIAQACLHMSHSRAASPKPLLFDIDNNIENDIDENNMDNKMDRCVIDYDHNIVVSINNDTIQFIDDDDENAALDMTNNASFCAPLVEENSSYLELPSNDRDNVAQNCPDIPSLKNNYTNINDDKIDNRQNIDYNKDPIPLEKTLTETAITQVTALVEEEAVAIEDTTTPTTNNVARTPAVTKDKTHPSPPDEVEEEVENKLEKMGEKEVEAKEKEIVKEIEEVNVKEEEEEEILSLPEILPLLDVGHLWTKTLQDHISTSAYNSKQPSARLLKIVSSLPPLLAISFSISSCTAASDQTAVSYNINQAKLTLSVMEKQQDTKESVRLPRGITKQLYLLHVQQGCTLPFQLDLLPSRHQKHTLEIETVDPTKLQQIIAQVPKITVKYMLPITVLAKSEETNDNNSAATISNNSIKKNNNSASLSAIVEESVSKDEEDDHHSSPPDHALAPSAVSSSVPGVSQANDIIHEQILSPYQLKKLLKRALTGLAQDKDVVWTPLWHRVSHSIGNGYNNNTNNKHLDVALWCRATAVRFDRIVSLVIGYIMSLFLQQVQLLVSQAAVTVSLTQLLVLLKDEDNYDSSNNKLDAEDIAGHTVLSQTEHNKLVSSAQTQVSQQLLQARHLQWQWQHTLSRLRALLRRELRRFDFDKKRLLDFASFANLHTAAQNTKPHINTTNEFGFTTSEKSTVSNTSEEDIYVVFDSDSDTDIDDLEEENNDAHKKKKKKLNNSNIADDTITNENNGNGDKGEEEGQGEDGAEGLRKQRRKTMSMSFTSAQLRQYTTVRRSSRHTNNPNGALSETPLAETADKELFSALHTLASTSIKDALTQYTLNLTEDKTVYNAAGVEVKLRQPRSPYKRHAMHINCHSNSYCYNAKSDSANSAYDVGNEGVNLVGEIEEEEEEENEDDETLAAYHAAYVRQQIQALWQPTPLSKLGTGAKGGGTGTTSPSPSTTSGPTTATWVDKISKMLLEFVHSLHVTNMLLAAPQMAQKVALASQAALEASLDILLQHSEDSNFSNNHLQSSPNLWQKLWFYQDVLLQMVGKKMAGNLQKKIEDFILSYAHYDEPDESHDKYSFHTNCTYNKNKHNENEENESDEDDFHQQREKKKTKGPNINRGTNMQSYIHEEDDDDRFMLHFLHLAQDSSSNITSNTNTQTPEEVLQGGRETALSVFLQALQLQQGDHNNSNSAKNHVHHLSRDNNDVKRFQDFVLGQRFILVSSPSCKTLRRSLTHHASSMKLKCASSSGKLK